MSRSYTDAATGKPPVRQNDQPSNPWGNADSKTPWNTGSQQQASSSLDPAAANFRPLQPSPSQATAALPAKTTTHDNKPRKSANAPASNPSARRKPSLKTMSIGDLIPKVLPERKRPPKPLPPSKSPRPQPKRAKGKATGKRVTTSVLSNAEFPALTSNRPVPPPPAAVQQVTAPGSVKVLKPVPPKKTASATTGREPPRKKVAAPVTKKESAAANTGTVESSFFSKQSPVPAHGDNGGAGGGHDLLRLYRDGKMVVQTKGRQRIRPRKKKFSALKKRVLQERLLRWQELHPEEAPAKVVDGQGNASVSAPLTCSVCVYGFIEPEELEDDDEYDEIVENLQEMANKVGKTKQVFIPRDLPDRSAAEYPSFVEFESPQHASAAVTCWDGLVVGGQSLVATALVGEKEDVAEWRDWCRAAEASSTATGTGGDASDGATGLAEVVLENALTEDDMEDDECLEETVKDIRALAEKHGSVQDIRLEKEPSPRLLVVYLGGLAVAQKAALALGNTVIGGQAVSAKVSSVNDESQSVGAADCVIILRNLLTDDDLEDDECLQECLNDVKELAGKYGSVIDVTLDSESDSRDAKLRFSSTTDGGKAALAGFNGMVVGGQIVSAVICERSGRVVDAAQATTTDVAQSSAPGPLFSGDKRISERFAECKRVPKIANNGVPRKYATLAEDDSVKPLLIEMLGELMRLQRRAIENNNTKAKRRLVMGLREVARGIRSHKVKMVVMANNLDQYGVIDEKLQEILDLAHEEGIPVFFEFSKRTLGKAIGKTIKIAVAAVQNAEGAHQQFKKLMALAPTTA